MLQPYKRTEMMQVRSLVRSRPPSWKLSGRRKLPPPSATYFLGRGFCIHFTNVQGGEVPPGAPSIAVRGHSIHFDNIRSSRSAFPTFFKSGVGFGLKVLRALHTNSRTLQRAPRHIGGDKSFVSVSNSASGHKQLSSKDFHRQHSTATFVTQRATESWENDDKDVWSKPPFAFDRIFSLRGMRCGGCASSIERAIQSSVPEGSVVFVDFIQSRARVQSPLQFDDQNVIQAIQRAGYTASADKTREADGETWSKNEQTHSHTTSASSSSSTLENNGASAVATVSGDSQQEGSTESSLPSPAEEQRREFNSLTKKAVVGWALTAPLLLGLLPHDLLAVQALLTAPVLYLGRDIFSAAVRQARSMQTSMDTLVTVGVGASFASSMWILVSGLLDGGAGAGAMAVAAVDHTGAVGMSSCESLFHPAALITTIVLTGRALEARARVVAAEQLGRVLEMNAPETGEVFLFERSDASSGADERFKQGRFRPYSRGVPLHVGDVLGLTPGSVVPEHVDVKLLSPSQSPLSSSAEEVEVSEAVLTGEERPVLKTSGETILGGSSVLGLAYARRSSPSFSASDSPSASTSSSSSAPPLAVVRVVASGRESTSHRIRSFIADAAASKPSVARLTDRVAALAVPAVLSTGGLTFGYWWWASGLWTAAVGPAVAVLVGSCACSVFLATPVAISAALSRAARSGLLFRDAAAIESAGLVRKVIFDKTRTLTTGLPLVLGYRAVVDGVSGVAAVGGEGRGREEGAARTAGGAGTGGVTGGEVVGQSRGTLPKSTLEHTMSSNAMTGGQHQNKQDIDDRRDSAREADSYFAEEAEATVQPLALGNMDRETATAFVALESHASHPWARHLAAQVENAWAESGSGIEFSGVNPQRMTTSAEGVEGVIGDKVWRVGHAEFAWFDFASASSLRSSETQQSWQGIDVQRKHGVRRHEGGSSHVFIGVDSRPRGIVYVRDELRPEAAETIRKLNHLPQIARVSIVSGDGESAVKDVGRQLNIPDTDLVWEATPEDKVAAVRALQGAKGLQGGAHTNTLSKSEQKERGVWTENVTAGLKPGVTGAKASLNAFIRCERDSMERHTVAFVGDGVNDSPALAAADLSVSLAGSTGLALRNASLVIVRSDVSAAARSSSPSSSTSTTASPRFLPSKSHTTSTTTPATVTTAGPLLAVPEAIALGQRTNRIIKENFALAIAYNFIVIPAAASGYLPAELAAAGMSLSSLMVISNSLRLLR